MFYERMLEEHKMLEKRIKELEETVKKFPEGKIFSAKNGKYTKWYLTDGKTQTYLPKRKRKLAEKLVTKKYLQLLIEDYEQEKRAIEFYLRHYNPNTCKAHSLLLKNPEYKDLLLPHFKPLSDELAEWSESPYDSNTKYPEQLIHKTILGKYLRSKSEVLIDTVLHKYKIPFRYEAVLKIGDSILYPDFTIRHPQTGKVFYWEHFGLMDDMNYIQNMSNKLRLYASNGIIPSINLITTYETQDAPLTIELVEKIVRYYFL